MWISIDIRGYLWISVDFIFTYLIFVGIFTSVAIYLQIIILLDVPITFLVDIFVSTERKGRIYQKFFRQCFLTYLLMLTSYFFRPLAILEICFLLNISLCLQGSLCRY